LTARRLTIRTPLGERLASESAHDSLWRAFELPIFEELIGSEGELLAAECEAHSGLHLATESAIFEAWYGELVVTSLGAIRYPILRLRTGWVGAIDRCACPCGERVMRFVPVLAAAGPARKPPVAALTVRRRGTEPAAAAV
jgi:phenylacetate-coenzyme A ligase PaaK-like adenylate-forming protein